MPTDTTYQPPKHLLEVLQKIEYEEALEPDDPRFVDTQEARGSQMTMDRLARKFGLSLKDGGFYPPTQRHVLFFGHIGSGKSTELRRYAVALGGPDRYFVVPVDVTLELDRNNVQYADAWMAIAKVLFQRLIEAGVAIDAGALQELQQWFNERVLASEKVKEFSAEVKSGVGIKAGLPYLVEVFSQFTSAFKANTTYKAELRRVIRNSFSDFAEAFNRFLRAAEEQLDASGQGKRVLFILDGTDKLRGEDTRRFFVEDAEQLLAIDAHVVYTAPLHLKFEGNVAGKLSAALVLPMIKLEERNGTRCEAGWRAMRDILLRRADRSLFGSDDVVNALVAHSGGHPRELLRLLELCCEFAEGDTIDADTAKLAIEQLASEFRRFLEPADYALLVKLDSDTVHSGNDERTRKLLYDLALLEYNDGAWRRSHPVVRLLEGYAQARAAAANTPPE